MGTERFRTQFQILVQGVSSHNFAIITGILCSIFLTPLLISYLGTEAYGLYAAAGSIMAYLFVLNLGTGFAVPKYVAERWARRDIDGLRRLVSSFFFAFLALALILILVGGLCLPYVHHLFKTSPGLVRVAEVVVFLTVTNFAIVLPCGVLGGLLYGIQKVHINYWLDTLFHILNLLAAYVVVRLGYGLVGVTLGTLGARAVVTLLLIHFVRQRCPAVSVRLRWVDGKLLKDLLTPAFHYLAINVSTLLIFSTDNLVISSLAGVSAVTAFSVASKLCRLPQGLIFSLGRVLFPHISELDALNNVARLRMVHTQLTKYSLLMALAIFTITAAFGKKVIELWVGPENFAGLPVLLTFCVLIPVNTVVQSSLVVLMGMARHSRLSWLLMVEGLVNVALSVVLLRFIGVLGVALGTLISRLGISFWFAPWYACRVLGQSFKEYWAGAGAALLPLVPCAGLAMLVAQVHLSPVLVVLGGSLSIGAAYLLFFYRFSLKRDERELIWNRVASLLGRSTLAA